MENLSLCRICLATDVRLCSVTKHLQDMYENITLMSFKREDRRPLVVCYICHARLQNCRRLRTSCLHSDKLLTEILNTGLKPQVINTFSVVSVVHTSMGHVLQDTNECQIKEEPAEITCDGQLDQQDTEDIVRYSQEEHSTHIDNNNQCSQLEVLDIIKRELEYVETDAEDIKYEIDSFFEEHDVNASLQSALNICPNVAKIVLEKIDLIDTEIGIPVFDKPTATDSHLVTELDYKNIVLIDDRQITPNNDKVDATLHEYKDDKDQRLIKANHKINKNVSKSNLESDICISAFDKPFQCDVCNKSFENKRFLNRHKRFIHTDEKPFQCSVCDKRYKRKSHLTQHMVTHTGDKHFQCDVCYKCFGTKHNLIQHMYVHTDERLFECNVCNKCFKRKCSLTQHMFTHNSKIRELHCELCNKFFASKQSLTRHMYTHTGDRQFQCDVCKKCFKDKDYLIKHTEKHMAQQETLYQCVLCNECFKTKDILTQHMLTHRVNKRFKCEMCKKGFSTKTSLALHVYAHTNEIKFQCHICNKNFGYKNNLTRHMYTHADEKRFQCDICKKCFKDKTHLARHVYTHTNERRFQCNMCKKIFKSKMILKQHMYTHTDETRWQCEVCNRFLSTKFNLRIHMRQHTLVRNEQ